MFYLFGSTLALKEKCNIRTKSKINGPEKRSLLNLNNSFLNYLFQKNKILETSNTRTEPCLNRFIIKFLLLIF